jgi:hypothetical protein
MNVATAPRHEAQLPTPHSAKIPHGGKDEDLGYFLFPILTGAKKECLAKRDTVSRLFSWEFLGLILRSLGCND